ncbi:MAG: SH3 domain-containing protein [Myxococcales bacterium]|nr:SH3 domain-containing protein [Myxococcales bacterium]MCB9700586.1 SH3 domain-containing protein [Myxococcales bacterium]
MRAAFGPGARALALLAVAWVSLAPARARADVVDDAFLAGNQAAAAGEWATAIERYREAEGLLPGRSAVLSFNLGTAYAQLGELGPATYHLRRALQAEAEASGDVAEAARRNLGIVRQRMEVAATTAGAQIDRSESWWELLLAAVAAPLFGWLALGSGWLGLVITPLAARLRGGAAAGARSLVGVLALVFVVVGALHGVALRTQASAPTAIVLPAAAAVREAPGAHRKESFTVQGGSRVRIVEEVPGWSRVRLPGGLEGWLPEGDLGRLQGAPRRRGAPSASRPSGGA